MKRLYTYLKRNGFDYEPVTVGSQYFPGFSTSFQAVKVRGTYRDIEKAEGYAAKYGYHVVSGGWLYGTGEFYTTLMRLEDWKVYDNYMHFQALSVHSCEIIIHKYHLGYIEYERMNRETQQVMDYCKEKAIQGGYYFKPGYVA